MENSIFEILQKREVCCSGSVRRMVSEDRFRNLTLQAEYETQRKIIKEIMVKHGVCVVLYTCGVSAAFSLFNTKNIHILNQDGEAFISSIHYNKHRESLITVSRDFANGTYTCRSRNFSELQAGAVARLFASESLTNIKVDPLNEKIMTHSAESRRYRVFDMKDYEELYDIEDRDVQDILISIGKFLLVRNGNPLEIEIRSIENGDIINSVTYNPLSQNKVADFIALFNEKILVKQDTQQLQIIDVRTGAIVDVSRRNFEDKSSCKELLGIPLFLTCTTEGKVSVLDLMGDLVTSLEDHVLWYSFIGSGTFITRDQDFIISYCQDGEAPTGSINVNSLRTGECFSKVKPSNGEDITAVYYDEIRHEIYTGNKIGQIQVFS